MTHTQQTLIARACLQNNVAPKTSIRRTLSARAFRQLIAAKATLIQRICIALLPVIQSCFVAMAKLGKTTNVALALHSNQSATRNALNRHVYLKLATLYYFAAKETTI